jgi:hypothetical protein
MSNISDDPEIAALEIYDKISIILKNAKREDEHTSISHAGYIVLDQWVKENKLFIYAAPPGVSSSDKSKYFYRAFVEYQNGLKEMQIRKAVSEVARFRTDGFGYAKLDKTEKEEIHKKLNHIRSIIEHSMLPDRKKNALYRKLGDLSAEVDRIGTKTDAFFGLMGDIGVHLGEFAENAKPMIDEVKDVIKIITRARARSEDVALPEESKHLLPGTDWDA